MLQSVLANTLRVATTSQVGGIKLDRNTLAIASDGTASLQAPYIATGRGYVNLAADGYCGPDGTDMLAGWNRAVADVQASGRGQGIRMTSGNWVTSRTLEIGLGTARVMVDGHEGQTIISSSTATVAFNITASQSNQTLSVTANASGGRIGIGTNITPSTGKACTVVAVLGGGTYTVNVSQTVPSGTMKANNPLMLIGGPAPLPNGYISGHVHGISLYGANVAPNDLSTGLTVASYLSMRLHHVEVYKVDIGIDAINNTFGLDLDQIWIGKNESCNVGVNIRGGADLGAGAGNQVKLDNVWSAGIKAGVQIGPGADGISIRGGQIGTQGNTDASGAIVLGKDYVTGTVAGVGAVHIDTVDFEGFRAWLIRSYSEFAVTMTACSIVGYQTTFNGNPAFPIGIVHATNDRNSNLTLNSNVFAGTFTSPVAILRDGTDSYAGAQYTELGSKVDGASFNGVFVPEQHPLVMQSGLTNATAFYNDYTYGPSIYAAGKTAPILGLLSATPIDPSSVANKGSILDPQGIQGSLDGTAMSSIADSIGAGNAYTQVTASSQPIYRDLYSSARLPNARPVLAFDGSDDFLSNADSASVSQTVFVVARVNTLAPAVQTLIGSNATGGLACRLVYDSQIAMESDGTAAIAATPNKSGLNDLRWHTYCFSFANAGAYAIWRDGVKLVSGTSSVTLATGKTRVIGRQAGGYYLNGQIAAVYPFTSVLTDATIAGIMASLKQQFGTP